MNWKFISRPILSVVIGMPVSKPSSVISTARAAVSLASLVRVGVCVIIGMVLGTVCLATVDPSKSASSQQVFVHGYGFKVEWVDATRVSTEMVNGQPGRNLSNAQSVRDSMGTHRHVSDAVKILEGSVPLWKMTTSPRPTSRESTSGVNFGPEARLPRSDLSFHALSIVTSEEKVNVSR